ncbi:MAG: 23S rRNA (uracil(1939)-C(5))-methyltransferase RlmD [Thermoanaerobacteraceae bacterium]|nr:23S rRNA (uracil(1939)-C(5))-methyltransferase RlmD [Thermoanaerobacteraceae bacterium]
MVKPPVSKGQQVKLTITDLTHEGEGVGRYQGFTLFVPGALPGEEVRAVVTEVKTNFGRAALERVDRYTSARVTPVCRRYDQCGGCQLQHFHYRDQLAWKRAFVQNTLKRIGGIEMEVKPVLGMDRPWNYRNKVQFHVDTWRGKRQLGFYVPGTHRLVPVEDCYLLPEQFRDLIAYFNAILENYSLIKQVWLRRSFAYGDLMVVITTRGPKLDKLPEQIIGHFAAVKSVAVVGPQNQVIAVSGEQHIKEKIGNLDFLISPLSFFQVNPVQTEVLYSKVREYAALEGEEVLWDLYCGTGTIGLFLADRCQELIGIEVVASAVADAEKNARLNRIPNAVFYRGKTEDLLPKLWKDTRENVVILDPPRRGCHKRLLESILCFLPERIVYVSCNPATLARDLKILAGAYRICEVQPVDMFPHTGHIECLVSLKRKHSE